MDLVISSPYMPVSGETISGSDFMRNAGGKGANQAAACGKLGGTIYMTGCVGDDLFGQQMINNLKDCNVNTDYIRIIESENSGIAMIIIVDGDNRIILSKGANACVTQGDIDALLENSNKGDIFLTQLENDIDIVGYALETAKNKGLYTILNPAPANKAIEKYFAHVDMIVPNQSESELFTDESTAAAAAEKMGVDEVVITLGDKGYYYYNKGTQINGDCMNVKVIDTTAAGDTFCAALAVKLSQDETMEYALEFASKAASLTCTKSGAQQAIPTIEEVMVYC